MAELEAQALELFDRYVDMAATARARHLERLREVDPPLHARLVRLLEADAEADEVLEPPQKILSRRQAAEEADPRIGTVLGAWRIDAVIGSGGMGRVYRASRADGQYAQTVALKCLRMDATSPELAAVLRNERDTLARLQHPNIATLLDGGIAPDGCPWFAMQQVEGEPIDAWCDRRRLGLRARVERFVALCDGLRHAHGKGALHGDIKPSNVLVDESGRPVLLDFGLSSLAGRRGERRLALTPGYAAPELAREGDSVATEIHALGMLLRVLLCGAPPPLDRGLAALGPPPAASVEALRADAQVAELRGFASPKALAQALAGDLDAIVAACVAPDPAVRPATVAQLQADLRAWLAHRPVSVREPRAGYRLRLFLRRNRIAAGLAALAVVGAGAGVATSWHFHQRASGQTEAAQAMRRLFERSFDALTTGGLGQAPLMSASMLREAEASLRSDEADGRLDARSVESMLAALARSYTTLGDYARAQALLDEAGARGAGQGDQRPALQAARAHLLNIRSRFAQAHEAALLGLAELDALPVGERLPARLALEVEQARAQWGMARIDEGRATLRDALVLAETMAPEDPRPLASLLIQNGQWQRMFLNYEAAEADYRRAIGLVEARAPLIADEARIELVSTLRQQSRHAESVALATELLERRRRVLGEDHPETGRAWEVLGASQFWKGDAAAAREALGRSEAILVATLGESHPETARTRLDIGLLKASADPDGDAEATARPALAIIERAYGPNHPETARAVGVLAAVLEVRAAGLKEPEPAWQEVIGLFERRVRIDRHQGIPDESDRVSLIKARLRVGEVDRAEQEDLEGIVASLRERFGATHDAVHNAQFALVEVYIARHEDARAIELLQRVLREVSILPSTLRTRGALMDAHEKLGNLRFWQGRPQEARAHWQQALAPALAREAPAARRRRIEEKLARLDAP